MTSASIKEFCTSLSYNNAPLVITQTGLFVNRFAAEIKSFKSLYNVGSPLPTKVKKSIVFSWIFNDSFIS